MKEYALLYRNDFTTMPASTPEQVSANMQRWMEWMNTIKDKGQLVSQGMRLERANGRVVKSNNVVTDGPYAEIKETIGGFSVIKAASFDQAVELSKGCPVLAMGGSVEVREIIPMY